MGPSNINATALSAYDIQVWWEPVQQPGANGVLRGYEVKKKQLSVQTQTLTGNMKEAIVGRQQVLH